MNYAAIVAISKEELLRWLGYEGGIIHRIYQESIFFNPGEIKLVIEHPDLPLVREHEILRTIRSKTNEKNSNYFSPDSSDGTERS